MELDETQEETEDLETDLEELQEELRAEITRIRPKWVDILKDLTPHTLHPRRTD